MDEENYNDTDVDNALSVYKFIDKHKFDWNDSLVISNSFKKSIPDDLNLSMDILLDTIKYELTDTFITEKIKLPYIKIPLVLKYPDKLASSYLRENYYFILFAGSVFIAGTESDLLYYVCGHRTHNYIMYECHNNNYQTYKYFISKSELYNISEINQKYYLYDIKNISDNIISLKYCFNFVDEIDRISIINYVKFMINCISISNNDCTYFSNLYDALLDWNFVNCGSNANLNNIKKENKINNKKENDFMMDNKVNENMNNGVFNNMTNGFNNLLTRLMGSFQIPQDRVALNMMGEVVVRSSVDNKYYRFNSKEKIMEEQLDEMLLPSEGMIMSFPTSNLNKDDIIYQDGEFYQIVNISTVDDTDGLINAINISTKKYEVLIPQKNVFMKKFYIKVFSFLSGFQGSGMESIFMMQALCGGQGQMNGMMPLMFMTNKENNPLSSLFGGESSSISEGFSLDNLFDGENNGMLKTMLMMQLFGGANQTGINPLFSMMMLKNLIPSKKDETSKKIEE